MGKIDFKKVEESLSKALQKRLMKKLVEGEPTVSERAVEFYRMDAGSAPKPQDAVIQELEQIEQEEKEFQEQEKRRLEQEKAQKEGKPVAPLQKKEEPPPAAALPTPPSKEEVVQVPTVGDVTFTPLFLLRKHILWFKQKHVKDLYKLLGTTPDEIKALRKKKELSEKENKRIQELITKAIDIKARIMKKLGIEEDSSLVEKERKRHIHKRFNIKDTWLPL